MASTAVPGHLACHGLDLGATEADLDHITADRGLVLALIIQEVDLVLVAILVTGGDTDVEASEVKNVFFFSQTNFLFVFLWYKNF